MAWKIDFTRSDGSSVIEKRQMKNFNLNDSFLLVLRQGYWNRVGVVSNDDEKRNKWKNMLMTVTVEPLHDSSLGDRRKRPYLNKSEYMDWPPKK